MAFTWHPVAKTSLRALGTSSLFGQRDATADAAGKSETRLVEASSDEEQAEYDVGCLGMGPV